MNKICCACGKTYKSPTTNISLLCPKCYKTSEQKVSLDKIEENLVCTGIAAKTEDTGNFIKADNGKLEWDLMPFEQLEGVVRILMFWKNKYAKDNWKKYDNPIRYQNAAMRHLVSYMKGEKIDPESGESHLSHLICNALFLDWFDKKETNS